VERCLLAGVTISPKILKKTIQYLQNGAKFMHTTRKNVEP